MAPVSFGRTNMPAAEVRSRGLAFTIMYARQKAINRVLGPQSHLYPNSMPFVTESAFEYLAVEERGAAEVARDAFAAYGSPDYELEQHFIYQRLIGPNDTALALTLGETLTILNDRQIKAVVLNTGMSAFTAMFDLLRPGDTLIYHPVLYGCTKNKVVSHLPKMGIQVVGDNLENLDSLRARLTNDRSARMILTETELNPTLYIPPIDKVAELVNEVNAVRLAKGWRPVFFVADNTFPTFANMNPLKLGIHCVVESMTKFLCGTGENMGGFIGVDMEHNFHLTDADYGDLYRFLMVMHKDDGLSMSPFPAWDMLRMLPSIEMRRNTIQPNAQKIAEALNNHPKIERVSYPGMMADKAQNTRARALMVDEQGNFAPGYMVYFVLKGTDTADVKAKGHKLLNWLSEHTSIRVKVSFGQQNTCIEMPSIMTHCSYSEKELLGAGIDPGGIRLAVGWDSASSIIDALSDGLKHI